MAVYSFIKAQRKNRKGKEKHEFFCTIHKEQFPVFSFSFFHDLILNFFQVLIIETFQIGFCCSTLDTVYRIERERKSFELLNQFLIIF